MFIVDASYSEKMVHLASKQRGHRVRYSHSIQLQRRLGVD
jgi:hypothetical protein